MLLDDNPETYWHTFHDDKSKSSPPHEVVIDMGRILTLEAFTFLPHVTGVGAPDQYAFYLSEDENYWTLAIEGQFTDLKQQRGLRVIPLPQLQSGRFIRFVAKHVVDDGDYVIVAGIGAIEAPLQR